MVFIDLLLIYSKPENNKVASIRISTTRNCVYSNLQSGSVQKTWVDLALPSPYRNQVLNFIAQTAIEEKICLCGIESIPPIAQQYVLEGYGERFVK